jgi:hypothetical protein
MLKPLAKARLGGILGSDCLPVLYEVLATLRIGALVSLLPTLSEHLCAGRVVLHLLLHSTVALGLRTGTQE